MSASWCKCPGRVFQTRGAITANDLSYNDWLRRELDLDIRGTCAWIPRRDGAENMTFISFGHNPCSIFHVWILDNYVAFSTSL